MSPTTPPSHPPSPSPSPPPPAAPTASPADGYVPRGQCFRAYHSQAPEVLISGPAGTGKSHACLHKMHLCAERRPGFRGLILRQTRESLTESALVTFEKYVLPEKHPARAGAQRSNRQEYAYPNGSTIAVRGLRQGGSDQAARVMSAEYDLVYVQEAIELREESWEALTTRLRNRRMGFQQLIADTNPDRPTHWLKRRCEAGRTQLFESRHEDNPTLWDERRREWTEFGRIYLARLDALTGPRKQRLRFGRWVQAEGVIYEGYDPAVHLIDRFPIPADWPRFWSIDFGYTNPFVCQFWARDPDGRLYRYREIYHTRRLVEDHAARLKVLAAGEPGPVAIVCDHDAEGRATLERHLERTTTPAVKSVGDGIQRVAEYLVVLPDGKPRLYFFRDALDQRDSLLYDHKKPWCTEQEMDGYVWDERPGLRKGDQPVKTDDHGADAMRYGIMYAVGSGWGLGIEADPTGSVFDRMPRSAPIGPRRGVDLYAPDDEGEPASPWDFERPW